MKSVALSHSVEDAGAVPSFTRASWNPRRYDANWVWGWFLLALFALQLGLDWTWPLLEQLQTDATYRQLSGALLAFIMLLQWRFAWLRSTGDRAQKERCKQRHKWQGVLAIVVFYLHSTSLGYAYQTWISVLFWGMLSPEALRVRARRYVTFWLILHVCAATACSVLALYHLYIVYTYH